MSTQLPPPRLIGLGGLLRAGKDEVAKHLAKRGYILMGMSDALNEALQLIGPYGPWVRLDFNVVTPAGKTLSVGSFIRYYDLLQHVGYVEAKRHDDVREYLQGLGTEVGRDMIDPDVWVNIAEKRIRQYLAEGKHVVITAVRFPNELEMIQRLGGTTAWVHRPSEARGAAEGLSSHASETSVGPDDFSGFIDNSRTLDDLADVTDWMFRLTENVKVPVELGSITAEKILPGVIKAEHLIPGAVIGSRLDIGPDWPVYDR